MTGHNETLKMHLGTGTRQPGILLPRNFMQHNEGLRAPCWQWRGCCAVLGHLGALLRSPVHQVTLQGHQCPEGSPDSSGCRGDRGTSLGHHNENSMGIFCHFKLDFKSQVSFKTLIQFFSLRGIDLLQCRLRRNYKRDCKTCSGFPSETQDQAWAIATCPCLHQVGSGASLVLPLQGAEGEIPSYLLAFLLP